MGSIKDFVLSVKAIAKKDLLIHTRYPLNLFSTVIALPIGVLIPLMMTAKTFGGSSSVNFDAYTGTKDYICFLVVGLIIFRCIYLAIGSYSRVLRFEQQAGTLERSFTLPVSRVTLLVGMSVYYILITLLQILVIAICAYLLFGFRIDLRIPNLLLAFVVLLLTVVISYGLGLVGGGLVLMLKDPSVFNFLIEMPLLLLCGGYYTVKVLPYPVQTLSRLIPLTYGIDAFRAVLTGSTTVQSLTVEFVVLGLSAIFFLLLGYYIFRCIEKKVLRRGSLGVY